ncbi:MAG: GNVR domain-containing protein [Vicinamibacteraceae bacterium]
MLPGRQYSPEDLIAIVWQRRWLILAPVFVCTFVALLYSRSEPDLYQAQSLIAVIPQRIPDNYVQSTVTATVQERLRTLTEQILSRTRLEKIIQEFGLYGTLKDAAPMEDVVDYMRSDEIIQVQAVGSNNRRQAGDTFHVRFTYPDPQLAQRVTERLASLYIEENSRERESLAESTNQFLEAQLADARERLEAQEKKLEQFREQHAGRLPNQMQSNLQAINGLQIQLQSMLQAIEGQRSRRLMLQQLYGDTEAEATTTTTAEDGTSVAPEADATEATTGAKEATGPGASEATAPGASEATEPGASGATEPPATEVALPDDESKSSAAVADILPVTTRGPASQQLTAAKNALAQAELRLKPEHPDILRLKRLIGELERKVAEEAKNPPDPNAQPLTPEEQRRQDQLRRMQAEMESLDRQIAFRESEAEGIRGKIADYQARLEAVPGLESEWVRLTRDYNTLQDQYRSLLQKSERSKIAMNLERRQISEQFRIIDAARLPTRPVSPNRLQISVAGLAAGFLIGFGLVALFEWRDSSFRTDGDVVGVLALPVLAVIPHVATRVERIRHARRRFLVTSATIAVFLVAGGTFWFLELWKFVS